MPRHYFTRAKTSTFSPLHWHCNRALPNTIAHHTSRNLHALSLDATSCLSLRRGCSSRRRRGHRNDGALAAAGQVVAAGSESTTHSFKRQTPCICSHISRVWGPMIRAWLEECLPADAHQRCSGRVTIAVRQVPFPALVFKVSTRNNHNLCSCRGSIPFCCLVLRADRSSSTCAWPALTVRCLAPNCHTISMFQLEASRIDLRFVMDGSSCVFQTSRCD